MYTNMHICRTHMHTLTHAHLHAHTHTCMGIHMYALHLVLVGQASYKGLFCFSPLSCVCVSVSYTRIYKTRMYIT